ncbi:type IV secretion system protein [Campylobacter helveticus]|uniref:type IV secretion system protein n=1 Tax=Campylobacter helveticus TaxID=28898 RepID=UPI0022EB9488|nr:type IV secretion system protein [Campylobacter helveticus]
MALDIFQAIGNIVESCLETIKEASLSDRMVELQAIVGTLLVISITFKGIQTMAGRNQDPIRDIVWDIGKKLFILTFILNVNGWLNLATSALDGFYEWAGGGAEFYKKLDELTVAFLKTIDVIWNKAGFFGGENPIVAVFVIFFMVLGFLGIMFAFAFTIINATITNTFLIIVLPLALFCLMYDFTKQAFNQWFNMFMSNIILLLLMSIFSEFLIKNIGDLYTAKTPDNPFLPIVSSIFMSAILIAIIQVVKTLASSLASVSLDAAAQAGMSQAMGSAGKGFGLAKSGAGAVSGAGLNMWKGGASGSALKAATRGGMVGLASYGAKKLWGKMRN